MQTPPDYWQGPKAPGKNRVATSIIVSFGVLLGGFQIYAFMNKHNFEVGKCYSGKAMSPARFVPFSKPCVPSSDPSRVVIRVTKKIDRAHNNAVFMGLGDTLAMAECLTSDELAAEMSKSMKGEPPSTGVPFHGALDDKAHNKVICYEVVKSTP